MEKTIKHLVAGIFLLLSSTVAAHSNDADTSSVLRDSLRRIYLVLENKYYPLSIVIIKEGEQVSVTDSLDRTFEGILSILNGETFVLTAKTGKKDTFLLAQVSKLGYMTNSRLAIAIIATVNAIVGIGIGVPCLITGYGDPDDIYTSIGTSFTIVGGLYGLAARALFKKEKHPRSKWKFRVIQTKGFELKKKDVKRL